MDKYPILQLGGGSIFVTDSGDKMIKLSNPERPPLSKLSDYPVWAADVGNGRIEKLDPKETVWLVGNCFELLEEIEAMREGMTAAYFMGVEG